MTSLYDKCLELDPSNSSAYESKGDSLAALDLHRQAIECYDRAMNLDPDTLASDYDLHTKKGDLLQKLNLYEQALKCFDKSLQINPTNDAYFQKAYTLHFLHRHKEAIPYYAKAIELDSSDAGAYLWKGHSFTELDMHKKALHCYDKAIELDPKYVDAYIRKGIVFDELGMYEKAIQFYDKAIGMETEPYLCTSLQGSLA